MNPESFKKLIIGTIFVIIVGSIVGIIFLLKPVKETGYGEIDLSTNYELKSNKCNEYKIVSPQKYDLPTLYHKQYLNYVVNDFDKAWELVPKEIKEKYSNSKGKYQEYCNSIVHKLTKDIELERFSESSVSGKKSYITVDKQGVKLKIIESGIWKYEAYVSGYVSSSNPEPATTKKK